MNNMINYLHKALFFEREKSTHVIKRILGVDQLRYVFAIWVFFKHSGAPPLFAGHADNPLFTNLDKLYFWGIDGQAAVIGFFIISGLCIHYPNIKRDTLNLKSFYTARFVRLAVPLLACLFIAKAMNYSHPDGFLRAVPIWTLYCEAMFYLAYPLVYWCAKKGWLNYLIVFSSLTSLFFIILWAPVRTENFHEIGGGGFLDYKAALLGFPCWLLGALIGERISVGKFVDRVLSKSHNLWMWRIGALALSSIIFPLYRYGNYHHLAKLPFVGLIFSTQFTLLLFGLYAFWWIEREVINMNFGKCQPNLTLERLGIASYSLYLVHILVIWVFEQLDGKYFPGYLLYWILMVIMLHIIMLLFFYLVERPSHKLSKYFSAALRK